MNPAELCEDRADRDRERYGGTLIVNDKPLRVTRLESGVYARVLVEQLAKAET